MNLPDEMMMAAGYAFGVDLKARLEHADWISSQKSRLLELGATEINRLQLRIKELERHADANAAVSPPPPAYTEAPP